MRLGMDLADDLGEHGVAHRAGRRWPSTPHVEPRDRHPDDTAGDLDGEAVLHDRGDDLEPPFGSVCSFNNSFARRSTVSSVSSARIRLRAALNSADSAVVTPGRTPRSTW